LLGREVQLGLIVSVGIYFSGSISAFLPFVNEGFAVALLMIVSIQAILNCTGLL
jgi:hypothetical protein